MMYNSLMTGIQRKQQLQQELDRIIPILRDRYQPEKVIAFGSAIEGDVHEWSDLDLAIIKDTPKRFIDRLIEVALLVRSTIATDYLVYTPKEFEEMARDNYFVRDEIIGKGKVVYEKNQTS